MACIKFLFLLFHFLTCISTVAYARCTEPVPAGAIFGCDTRFYCYETGNLTSNSTYARNRDLILASLASNATANGGFYTGTIGQGPDKVYGLVFCRPDSSSEACSKCVNAAIQDLVVGCPYQKEVISWGWDPPCIVRYANRSLFGLMESYPTDFGCNPNNITSNLDQFDQIWGNLMENLVNKPATTGLSNVKFATGEADWVSFQKMYALMTCTPDISQNNCSYCLREAVDYYNRQCHGKQGGFVQKPNCIMRWDLYPFYKSSADAPGSPPLPTVSFFPRTNRRGSTSRTVVIIIIPTIILLALVCFSFRRWKSKRGIRGMNENSSVGCLELNFATIRLATNNFSVDNKLGQGGFGAVYKGRLSDGQTIAVKRLSRNSRQGEVEFKNELMLMARLRHRNLSKLLGFCLEGNERILIYEFLQNSSLDKYVFDPNKRFMLDWEMCYKIIVGIARGILYLHEDSQLLIIHRDLKASNILLDEEMNPKISDFGMARLFELDRTHDTTSRVAGTFGYMAPEYAIRGRFSVKSDVFSFGVLLLEIISGKRNSTFFSGEGDDDGLLAYAWKNWNEGTTSKLIDATLLEAAPRSDVNRCIHIGLLCVQESVANRPTMGSVVLMLSSLSFVLPIPSTPAFLMHSSMNLQIPSPIQSDPGSSKSHTCKSGSVQSSVNEASVTDIHPR